MTQRHPNTISMDTLKAAIQSAVSTAIESELPKAVAKAVADQKSRPEYLSTAQASAYTGISTFQFAQWRSHGGGPDYVKLAKLVKYPRASLDQFMMSRLRDHTA